MCIFKHIGIFVYVYVYLYVCKYIYEYSICFRIYMHINRQIDGYDYDVYNMSTYVHIHKCVYI
jgi:hypothetical protein